jgi:hypothetical protein
LYEPDNSELVNAIIVSERSNSSAMAVREACEQNIARLERPTEFDAFNAGPASSFEGEMSTFSSYSGFDSALYRNVDAEWHFSQENAASYDLPIAALESKPL